ncbi:hypothetical protein IPG41_00230 [Candidatus Peregrinibacteria bacterium]|nr:MAG: hypothetical protein IPG41_00230 [Candidatus Peregrinibacteria bacterium]
MNTCASCSMPLDEAHGFGTATEFGQVCQYCLGSDGKIKDCAEIFEGGIQFFMTIEGVSDRAMGERLTRKNMKNSPYWKTHPNACLEGEEASDEEFYAVLLSFNSEFL